MLRFGDHHEYPGDHPWWTLRFREPLSAADVKAVGDFVQSQHGVPAVSGMLSISLRWHEGRQVQLEGPEGGFSPSRWEQFYVGMDAFFERLDAKFGLFAVFLQDGQFFDGRDLVHLPDHELAALAK